MENKALDISEENRKVYSIPKEMSCGQCLWFNNKYCPVSSCYNNNPKNGYKTRFSLNNFCSYFEPKVER